MIIVRSAVVLLLLLTGVATNMNAQTKTEKLQGLDARQRAIVSIAALTATGDLEKLRAALSGGLDGGLTVNEIKDVLAQMYAYAGFPRSLNGIGTFMSVVDERNKRGLKDIEGRSSMPVTTGDRYERGRKTLEKLTRATSSEARTRLRGIQPDPRSVSERASVRRHF